jgi:phosphate transport system ATP-binding protein
MVDRGSEASVVAETQDVKVGIRDLSVRYHHELALEGVSFDIHENEIFGIIGPANAGKTSFLKAINRMDMFTEGMSVGGHITFNGVDVNRVRNVYGLRRRIGVVFPLPVGLPLTVYDNVALAPRLGGQNDRAELDVIVERCLRRAALWDEPAGSSSG